MDLKLHTAAMKGNRNDLMESVDLFNDARTPNGNTVLHVATQFEHLECVRLIAEKCPDLLNQVNSKGETALHIAARRGYRGDEIVKAIIDCAKNVLDPESAEGPQMLRFVNEDGDTALHLAARQPLNDKVLELLTEVDPEFQHPPNKAQETPLYLACETATVWEVETILENCRSPAYSGPGCKTALHAAAVSDSSSGRRINALLDRWPDLVIIPDEYGWTPLHYAARANNILAVSKLLKCDRSVAYVRTNDDDGNNTALHVAVTQEFIEVMEKILSYCSDCWEMTNAKRQNILHIAVDMEKNTSLKFLRNQNWYKCLLNQKDNEGNTPLHLLASWTYKRSLSSVLDFERGGDWAALNNKNLTPMDILVTNYQVPRQSETTKDETLKALVGTRVNLNALLYKQENLRALLGVFGELRSTVSKEHLRALLGALLYKQENLRALRDELRSIATKENLRALLGERRSTATKNRRIYIPGWRNVVNDDRERMKKLKDDEKMNEEAQVDRFRKMANAHLIAATLIATVTFAAAFTLPGGYYDSAGGKNQGTAILLKKVAFRIFIVSNTIAVASSTASVFLHVAASLYDDRDELLSRYRKAFYLILIAIVAMVLAFVTGIYVVLAPSLSLAIATCVIGSLISFLILVRELIKMALVSKLWFLMTDFYSNSWFLMMDFFSDSWLLMKQKLAIR